MEGNAAGYDHEAPPTQAPMSGAAITALVLAIVFQCGSVFGVWWVNGVGMVLAVLAWPAIAAGRRRGAGVAIAAAVIALAGAILSFSFAHAQVAGLQRDYDGLLATIERAQAERAAPEIEKLKPSVLPGEDANVVVGRWIDRYQKIRAEVGPYTGPATFSSSPWGLGPMISMLTPPDSVEEVSGDGSATPGPGESIWFQAAFEKGTLWVAAELGKGGKIDPELMNALLVRGAEGHTAVARDLRYFRSHPTPPK